MRGSYSRGRGGPEPMYFYYRCSRQWDNGSCSHNKQHRAEEVEGLVWELMRDLLAQPDDILEALEEAIEAERKALSRGNPEAEAKAWLDRIAEADRKRDGYLDLAADGILPREELLEKLSALEEMRTRAEAELSKIEGRTETVRRLERDLEAMKERYAQTPSEAFDSATPEDRHHLYGACGLQAVIHPDGLVEINTTILPDLPEEGVLCGTATRCSTP